MTNGKIYVEKGHPITWESLGWVAVGLVIVINLWAAAMFAGENNGWVSIRIPITCADGSSTSLSYRKNGNAFLEGQIMSACGNDLLHNISIYDAKNSIGCHTDDSGGVKCEKY